MNDCIFCKIVNKEIPAKVLYENETLMVFMDINPATYGHLLVIPKDHYQDTSDTPDEVLQKIIVTAKEYGIKSKEKLGADGFNIVNASGKDAQQSVFHLHYHVVPRYKEDGLNLWHQTYSNSKNIEDAYRKMNS
jgi:histidine triad (HIT) family protein